MTLHIYGENVILLPRNKEKVYINCYAFFIVFLLLLLGFDALEPRFFWKQPLYLHEVAVRSAYTLSYLDATLWNYQHKMSLMELIFLISEKFPDF